MGNTHLYLQLFTFDIDVKHEHHIFERLILGPDVNEGKQKTMRSEVEGNEARCACHHNKEIA